MARRTAPANAKSDDTSPAGDALGRYREKRDFAASPEPRGGPALRRGRAKGAPAGLRFCVQKHAARRLHYDLRLELDGVLLSWAVTRGPSLVPKTKRLAVHTEDHPLDYLTFEGLIPEASYGGGAMIVWDEGAWEPEGDARADMARGRLTFTLKGARLGGRWHLVRTGAGKERRASAKENWLLIKSDDEAARPEGAGDILAEETTSIRSGRTIEDLKSENVLRADWDEKIADPKAKPSTKKPPARETAPSAETKAPAKRTKKEPEPGPGDVTGARKAPLPAFVPPCLATLSDKAPSGERWLHEIKFDGYRLQARIEGGKAKLLTRKGLDWTAKFGALAQAIGALGFGRAALADAAWREAASRARKADAARLDGLLAPLAEGPVRGTTLFRTIDTPRAPEVFTALGRAGIWVRRFQDAPRRLRLGLPGDADAWARLEGVLTTLSR